MKSHQLPVYVLASLAIVLGTVGCERRATSDAPPTGSSAQTPAPQTTPPAQTPAPTPMETAPATPGSKPDPTKP